MKIKALVLSWLNGSSLPKCWIAILLLELSQRPLLGVFCFLIKLVQAYRVSFAIFGVSILPKVYYSMGLFRIRVNKARDVKLRYPNGMVFVLEKWKSGNETNLFLDSGSELTIKNTFTIGDGCKIHLQANSKILLGGKSPLQSSGITCDTIISCSHSIDIGEGSIISWGVYISDSSQHKIEGIIKTIPIVIGDHVWISEGVTCSPGCNIGAGSIVGSKSYVNKTFPSAVFLAGAPARIIKENIMWSR